MITMIMDDAELDAAHNTKSVCKAASGYENTARMHTLSCRVRYTDERRTRSESGTNRDTDTQIYGQTETDTAVISI